MITASFAETIDLSWIHAERIVLGRMPRSEPTPDRYVLIDSDGCRIRCDIFISEPESFSFEELKVWGTLLVIGYGCCVYCVDLQNHETHTHRFDSYFGHSYVSDDYCLIASGEELMRLKPDGTVLWRSAHIAIDGVIVEDVRGDTVRGQAEWDPPGGWEEFKVSLASGRILKGRSWN